MVRILTAIALCAAFGAEARPLDRNDDSQSLLQKRQLVTGIGLPKGFSLMNLRPSMLYPLFPLITAATSNDLGRFFGEEEATPGLMAFGRLLGANKTSAGGFPDFMLQLAKDNGRVFDPLEASNIPKRQSVPSQLKNPAAKAVKMRYGPYKVPGSLSKSATHQMPRGMLENYPDLNFQKPCEGDCTIIGMRPDLEWPNGTVATIDSGPWLHHAVVVLIGPGRKDLTCEQYDVSIPHMGVNSTPNASERILAVGNERLPFVFPDMGHDDIGYKFRNEDKLAGIIDLANENREDAVVYFTITWDYIDGHPFKDEVTMVHHDIRNCGSSEANPPKSSKKFALQSSWKSNVDADIIGVISHTHDGAISTTLSHDGNQVCESIASYGTRPGYTTQKDNLTHLSDMSICAGDSLKVKQIKRDQQWQLKANYDFDKHPGLIGEHGQFDKVMGINFMFIRKPA